MTERNKANHSNQVEFELDPVVLLALLGTIVLDTINMDKGANRGTPRDQYVLDQLMYHTNWSSKLLPHITDFYLASNNWNPSPSFNTQPLLSLQRITNTLGMPSSILYFGMNYPLLIVYGWIIRNFKVKLALMTKKMMYPPSVYHPF